MLGFPVCFVLLLSEVETQRKKVLTWMSQCYEGFRRARDSVDKTKEMDALLSHSWMQTPFVKLNISDALKHGWQKVSPWALD